MDKLKDKLQRSQVLSLLLFMAGVYGILFFIYSVPGISCKKLILAFSAFIPGTVLWYIGRKWRKLLLPSCLAFMLVMGAMFWLWYEETAKQMKWLFGRILWSSRLENADVSLAVFIIIMAVSFLLFLMEFVLHMHWLAYICTSILLLTGPFSGIYPKVGATALLVIFQISFWGTQRLRKQQEPDKAVMKIGGILTGAVFVLFFVSMLTAEIKGDWFYETIYEAEGYIQRKMKQAENMDDTPSDGEISRGNLYPAGTAQIELVCDVAPTERMFLKGFSGGEYKKGKWQPNVDEKLFERVKEDSYWERIGVSDSVFERLNGNMYYIVNSRSNLSKNAEVRGLTLTYKNKKIDTWHLPYFSETMTQSRQQYFLYYFERKDMQIDWGGDRDFQGVYHRLRDGYREQAKEEYTKVTTEDIPRLAALCEANPKESVEEITEFIIQTLHDNAKYTRTPGMFPMNEDPVEYFLFEKKQGYCQHFASAAVLMYRLYGVPARYATGYAVNPEDFERDDNRSYSGRVDYCTELTDQAAHAWPEIYTEDNGWYPVEVTPAEEEPEEPQIQAQPDRRPQGLTDNGGASEERVQDKDSKEEKQREKDTVKEPGQKAQGEKYDIRFIVAGGMICTVLFVVLFLLLRRKWKLRKMETMNCRQLFAELLEVLYFSGNLKGYDGSEAEFALQISETFAGVPKELVQEMTAIVERATFDSMPVSSEDKEKVREAYVFIVGSIFQTLRWHKKLCFKYIKVFL